MKEIRVSATLEKIVIQPGKDTIQVILAVDNNQDHVQRLTAMNETVKLSGIGLPEQITLLDQRAT